MKQGRPTRAVALILVVFVANVASACGASSQASGHSKGTTSTAATSTTRATTAPPTTTTGAPAAIPPTSSPTGPGATSCNIATPAQLAQVFNDTYGPAQVITVNDVTPQSSAIGGFPDPEIAGSALLAESACAWGGQRGTVDVLVATFAAPVPAAGGKPAFCPSTPDPLPNVGDWAIYCPLDGGNGQYFASKGDLVVIVTIPGGLGYDPRSDSSDALVAQLVSQLP